jgi:hypothetical protein
MEEGSEENNSPKVAAAELAGVGRDCQATAGATRVCQSISRKREGERGAGLGRFDRPRPEPVWFNQPGGLDWAKAQLLFEFK